MKRLTTPEALAFVVPVLAMIAIVLLTAYSSSVVGMSWQTSAELMPHHRAAINSF
jgi:hypothetical protein